MKDRQRTDDQKNVDTTDANGALKSYVAPAILSVEPLEAVAAACNSTGGFGKSTPTCNPASLGS